MDERSERRDGAVLHGLGAEAEGSAVCWCTMLVDDACGWPCPRGCRWRRQSHTGQSHTGHQSFVRSRGAQSLGGRCRRDRGRVQHCGSPCTDRGVPSVHTAAVQQALAEGHRLAAGGPRAERTAARPECRHRAAAAGAAAAAAWCGCRAGQEIVCCAAAD
eukprot:scaffold97060_cov57-Phaeocystis_antarctica.AAC.2